MTKKCFYLLPLLLSSTLTSIAFAAEEVQPSFDDRLFGNMSGLRNNLDDKGVSFDLVYTGDVFSNVSGGIKEGTRYMDNLDISFGLDGEKILGVKGLSASIYFLNNNGGKFNANLVGSGEGVDNIEVAENTFKLYEAWLEQKFWNDKASIRAGLYDSNSEFEITDASGVFINPTLGMNTALAVTGVNGPSAFPVTSLAVRLLVTPTERSYFQAAIFDGVPGDPGDPDGTQISLADGDGALFMGEAGYRYASHGHYAVGGWHYTEDFAHLSKIDASGNPLMKASNGFYVLGEKRVYAPEEGRGLDVFFRIAFASEDVNEYDYSWSSGFSYTGPCSKRQEDVLGFAIHSAHNGQAYKESVIAAGGLVDSAEYAMELTYKAPIFKGFSLQPDVQYIINPATDKTTDDAFVIGIRSEFNF